jgi:hypothetical protein
MVADAELVEFYFQTKLATFDETIPADLPAEAVLAPMVAADAGPLPADPIESPIEITRFRRRVTPKTIRLRDKLHCKFVATQPCVVCGRTPAEAHHLRFTQPRALSRKVSDEFTVPVCRLHHRELHRYGDEASWWAGVNIDPVPLARSLWKRSREPGMSEPDESGSPLALRTAPVSQTANDNL